ncbi:MAG: TIGR02099 family protein [Betaproteobacteria bacterium]|nr:TIGR02099 family protein [Betaproteobacteria bacterium]
MLGWLLTLGYFGFALIFLTLRYAILPHIGDYRSDIERILSASINLPVTIASIDSQWQGLRPNLALHGFAVRDRQGRPALALDNVEAELSWTSLLHFSLRLHRLEIAAPALTIRRDAAGRIFIAGLQLNAQTPENRNDFADWLLTQRRVVVRDASIVWQDELRGAAPLTLQRLNFQLLNDGSRHRFGLTAEPPRALAARLDLRGDFRGRDLNELEAWKGQVYAEMDYADLAFWRAWAGAFDKFALELPQGSGGMRLWLSFEQWRLTGLTADIALADVQLRLAQDLPLLDLLSMNGRLSGQRLPHGFQLAASRLNLRTRDGIEIQPTDFKLRWSEAAGGSKPMSLGEFTANNLDLDALVKLAAYLPLGATARQRLTEAAPHGRLFDLKSAWSGADGDPGLAKYSLRARFERLGMRAQGSLPGFEGVSGSIDANDQDGTLILDSRQAAIEMPTVFPEPRLDFDTLSARTSWKTRSEGGQTRVEVKLDNVAFENRDAAGSASGRYQSRAGEPGEIDLQARLTRASGAAVWRYMPLAVNKDVGAWLHAAIVGGSSNDTSLRLKGDLKHFPFTDGSGIFEVKGKFHDATLRYAPDWPQIDNIAGELEFVGKHMLIKASRGSIYGATVSDVKAEIADLWTPSEPLVITGKAAGPTTDFLRFVETSPVGEHIEHFTEDMTATGSGQLNLRLVLPLLHLADAKTSGVYRFTNNTLMLNADAPPLTDVNGHLQFSGDGLKADKVRAALFGSPLTVDVKTAGNGVVLVNADGKLNVAGLRKQYAYPLLDHLSGGSSWHGSARVRKKSAEIVIESKLQGLSSSLPEPFNKSANEALPLRLERKTLPGLKSATALAPPRDQIEVTLGKALAARFIRRQEGENTLLERGAITLGEPLAMPDKGLLLSANLKKIDVDFWRRMLNEGGDGKGDSGLGSAFKQAKITTSVALRTGELMVFGHALHDLELKANSLPGAISRDSGWHAEVKSRELSGDVNWLNQGAGRLTARLKQLAINDAAEAQPASGGGGGTAQDEIPGLDIEADQFLLRGKPYGKLKLTADNREGTWLAKFGIDNDDARLTGEGKWRPATNQPDTHLKFTLNVKSIEKLLARLNYPDAMRRGSSTLEGNVSWYGSPFAIDIPSLSGTLKVEAANGQFNKIEPGVGRLLGILSLQSLPRRITLDFRDIFSEGFAFDSIAGEVNLNRGIMDAHDFRISGPSAKILMSGSVSLPDETQNLKVRVQPALGETLGVGAMLSNPATGAIVWLADKILKNPLDQIFASDYAVTGSWADPKVEKLSGSRAKDEKAAPLKGNAN